MDFGGPVFDENGKPRVLNWWQRFLNNLIEWSIAGIVFIGLALLYYLYWRAGLPVTNPGKNIP